MRILARLFILAFLSMHTGCGGYSDKGINQDKDKPSPTSIESSPESTPGSK